MWSALVSRVGNIRGFTLIELLIALAVFSVMSVMAYSGLRTLMTTRERTDELAQRLAQIQTAFILIQQDMELVAPRGVRDEYGEREAALTTMGTAGYPLLFTRGGQRSRFQPLRSAYQRVAYQVEDGTLYRLSWPVLDGAEADSARLTPLIQGVEDISFQFLDKSWGSAWPPAGGGESAAADEKLPKAIEIQLTVEHWGSIRRLYALP